MTHELVDDDIDDPIPASIVVPRGLPPCREALARYMAYRQQIAAAIARLETGRDKLITELARADAVKAENEQAFEAEASTLAERVLSGATFTGKPKPVPDVRLTRAALVRIEAELASKQALADRLTDRYGEFVNAALREEGAGLGQEYLALIDQLRNTIGRLHALDVATGGPGKRDVRAMVPGFCSAGQPSRQLQIGPGDDAVSTGIASWKALGRAWSQDPKASPRAHLKFRLRDRPEFT